MGANVVAGNHIFKECIFVGGGYGTYNHGFSISNAASPIVENCVFFCNSSSGVHNRGIAISNQSSPHILNCSAIPKFMYYTQTYTGTGYTVLPIAGAKYYLNEITVYVSTAGGGGSTISMGTTDGGTEIGTVTSTSTGWKVVKITKSAFSADTPFYVKPSDTNTRFKVYVSFAYNYASCWALYVSTTGNARILNSNFESCISSEAAYISTLALTGNIKIRNCSFENATTGYSINAESAGSIDIKNCSFEKINNITLPGQGTAATITVGNTYVDVTHSLASTPTKVRVTPTTNLGTRSFWVDTKGASTFRININSSDSIDHTFDWEAEV